MGGGERVHCGRGEAYRYIITFRKKMQQGSFPDSEELIKYVPSSSSSLITPFTHHPPGTSVVRTLRRPELHTSPGVEIVPSLKVYSLYSEGMDRHSPTLSYPSCCENGTVSKELNGCRLLAILSTERRWECGARRRGGAVYSERHQQIKSATAVV